MCVGRACSASKLPKGKESRRSSLDHAPLWLDLTIHQFALFVKCPRSNMNMRFFGWRLGTDRGAGHEASKKEVKQNTEAGHPPQAPLPSPDSGSEVDVHPTEKNSERYSSTQSWSFRRFWSAYVSMSVPYEAYNDHLCTKDFSTYCVTSPTTDHVASERADFHCMA